MFYKLSSTKSLFDYFIDITTEIQSASKLLLQLFSENEPSLTLVKKIKDHEHKADNIVHEIIKDMSTSYFILPLDRDDIMSLITKLDDVLDMIHESAESFSEIYCLTEPTDFASRFAELIHELSGMLMETCELIKQTSKNSSNILDLCIKIHYIENQADELKKAALRDLFQKLKDNTISVPNYIAWNTIYNTLEIVTDKAEDCANIAEEIVLKYS